MKQREKKPCKFCSFPVDIGRLTNHEKLCAKKTDAQRAHMAAQRAYYYHSTKYLEHARRKPVVSNGHIRVHSRRVHISLSCDFSTLRELLLNLAPSLSVDKVELL